MQKNYVTILVLAIATTMIFAAPVPCRAAEKEEESVWSEDEPKGEGRRFELTEERIERIMNQLAEADPEKAKELEQLREKDPEKFKAELREAMQQQFSKRFKERLKERSEQPVKKHGGSFSRGGMPPGAAGMLPGTGQQEKARSMHRRHAEYLEWLEKSYPEEAEKLAELRETKPGLHMRQMALALKKYRRIFEAEEENPKLAEVLKEDLVLKQQRDKLLRKIRAASEDAEKKELTKQLEEVVSSRFDLIVKRKQIECEQLLEKLKKLKKRVEESEAKVEKWKDAEFKNESVKARLEELVGKTDEFRW